MVCRPSCGPGDNPRRTGRGCGDGTLREGGVIEDAFWPKGDTGDLVVGVLRRETGRSRVARPTTLDTGVFFPAPIVDVDGFAGGLREPLVAPEVTFAFGRMAKGGEGESEDMPRLTEGRASPGDDAREEGRVEAA